MIKRKEHEFFELNYLRHLKKADLKRFAFLFFFSFPVCYLMGYDHLEIFLIFFFLK